MSLKELIDAVNRFHGDLSRSREETRAGLEELASHIDIILDSLDD